MQTKYEQITELRETATLINQLEFKINILLRDIEIYKRTNTHKENTDLIQSLLSKRAEYNFQIIKAKQVFDLLLSNVTPYYYQ